VQSGPSKGSTEPDLSLVCAWSEVRAWGSGHDEFFDHSLLQKPRGKGVHFELTNRVNKLSCTRDEGIPSGSAFRSRSQTAPSCSGKRLWWCARRRYTLIRTRQLGRNDGGGLLVAPEKGFDLKPRSESCRRSTRGFRVRLTPAPTDLSKLVNLRAARKPISDARTTTYLILSTGSGPGGPGLKSSQARIQ
jgi:hypothetical protein